MSRKNKVNKDHYTQRGRLTADDLARERAREISVSSARRKFTAGTTKPPEPRRDEPASTPARSERVEEE
jgi:hypothetical protein